MFHTKALIAYSSLNPAYTLAVIDLQLPKCGCTQASQRTVKDYLFHKRKIFNGIYSHADSTIDHLMEIQVSS